MKFSIDTLGCKINQSESDYIAKELLEKGLESVSREGHPDLCIINTCTVTSQSDRKTRQLIRRIKSKNKNSKIIVTGCFTVYNREFLKSHKVDFIVNNIDKHKIPKLIEKIAGSGESLNDFDLENFSKPCCLHSRPLIKIQDGCEQKCSYCIVPKVRGKYRSVPYREVIKKIEGFQRDGFEEIVLTGVNIGKYGIDFKNNGLDTEGKVKNLTGLLEKIIKETKIKRIRISSIEASEIDSNFLDVLEKNKERFARHLHIPVQSGSNMVLEFMKRPYTAEYFIEKVRAARNIFPDITLTTDVMVGFPGEGKRDFIQTAEIVRKAAFSKIHVFKFSKRLHTRAYGMDGQVSEEVKSERSKMLRDIGGKLRDKHIGNSIGKSLNVVCEEMDNKKNIISGTSENYIKVYFSPDKKDFYSVRGKILKVDAGSKYKDGLWGVLNREY